VAFASKILFARTVSKNVLLYKKFYFANNIVLVLQTFCKRLILLVLPVEIHTSYRDHSIIRLCLLKSNKANWIRSLSYTDLCLRGHTKYNPNNNKLMILAAAQVYISDMGSDILLRL
jgi:hypothetical protein